jgi:hypothetical protein
MRAVLVAPWPMFNCQRCGAAVQSLSAAHAQAGAIEAAAKPHRNPRVSFIFSVPRKSSRGRKRPNGPRAKESGGIRSVKW